MKPLVFLISLMTLLVISACVAKPYNMPKTKNATVYIIHGYGATPSDHWFLWLHNALNQANVNVKSITLPNSQAPDFNQWQQTLDNQIGIPNEHDIFVAHSLGNPTLLHYLSQRKPKRIGGLILVSGFFQPLPHLPNINGYDINAYMSHLQLDLPAIAKMSPNITHIISDNDSIVTPNDSQKLVSAIGGDVVMIAKGGHLLGGDGFTTLPEALKTIQIILNK